MVSGSNNIAAIRFKVVKKRKNHFRGKMLHPERSYLYGKFFGCIGQEQGEDIPIRLDGLITAALYAWQVLFEEPMDARFKLHKSTFCEMAKSKSP
jgi:hypothetical protein